MGKGYGGKGSGVSGNTNAELKSGKANFGSKLKGMPKGAGTNAGKHIAGAGKVKAFKK
jgi:hypothetical protein